MHDDPPPDLPPIPPPPPPPPASGGWVDPQGAAPGAVPPGGDAGSYPGAETPGPAPRRKGGARSWIAAGAVTLVAVIIGALVIGRAGHSSATTPSPSGGSSQSAAGNYGSYGGRQRPGTQGTITGTKGGTLTLQSTDPSGSGETVTVTTSGDTVVRESVVGTVADVKVGDNVVVRSDGSAPSGSNVTATAITDTGTEALTGPGGNGGPPAGATPPDAGNGQAPPADGQGTSPSYPGGTGQGGRGFGVRGTVTAVSGGTVTVASTDGTSTTVSTTPSTTVSVLRSITVSDLKIGDTVRVTGQVDGSSVAATSIQKGDLGAFGGPGGPNGTGGGGRNRNDNGNGNGNGNGNSNANGTGSGSSNQGA